MKQKEVKLLPYVTQLRTKDRHSVPVHTVLPVTPSHPHEKPRKGRLILETVENITELRF